MASDHGGDPHEGPAELEAPATITCVDCGGVCHLLSHPRPDEDATTGFVVGDIVAYRCEDCLDRWDIELA
jgi:hypothetical protein